MKKRSYNPTHKYKDEIAALKQNIATLQKENKNLKARIEDLQNGVVRPQPGAAARARAARGRGY